MIFAMARRMLVWDDENYQGRNDTGSSRSQTKEASPLPRWRPHGGISDYNPSFRKKAPAMNSMGYAGVIRRNSRKRNKPAMWRYSLRTYERMSTTKKIPQRAVHHEAALVACSKLGLWRDALELFEAVEQQSTIKGGKSGITDNMLFSLIRSCVRASRMMKKTELMSLSTVTNTTIPIIAQQREPLDVARDVLSRLEHKHGIQVVARHINPLAAAYQSFQLYDDATTLVETHLKPRCTKASLDDPDRLNIKDITSKDTATYNLLIKSSVSNGDWKNAVQALEEMTESGLYPNQRSLNSWNEVSEKGSRRRRRYKSSISN